MELICDVLIVGGGVGGVAAALAASDLGRQVVLTEAGSRVGGQLTSQAVPPDEHPWVETTGSTARYRRLREAVRTRYKQTRRLTEKARLDALFNPGAAWVSNLSAEPEVFREVLGDLLRPAQAQGLLRCLMRHRPVGADMNRDQISAVSFENLQTGERLTITADYVLDATEEGDLLPLAGGEFVVGAESATWTGEPHALPGPADPLDQQAITWCAALEWRPGEDHTIDRPEGHEFWRSYRADFWPGPQLGWATQEPETGRPLSRPLFSGSGEPDLWTFRRIRYGGHYTDEVSDVTLVNWPQVDYWLTPLIGVTEAERRASLVKARELSLCFVRWLQTDAPRPDGGTGYPGLRLCPEVLGTEDGLAANAYIRESRRIAAEFTVLETHVGVEARPGADRAEAFPDTVGVGSYRIDLHPSTAGRGYLDIATDPFQIPLGALLPQRLDNLVAAGKCLGVTHVTNGCYRLHPVEWNVGEAAGALAAHCLNHRVGAGAVRSTPGLLADFQRTLLSMGVQLQWPEEIQTKVR
ncbi:MAG TPA: FAD-dependent oxidoreductase [Propionibacteriaceae bacterium]|nr:FAD-dependent oxidoreductase [Propionibacteriaceae bacterium]